MKRTGGLWHFRLVLFLAIGPLSASGGEAADWLAQAAGDLSMGRSAEARPKLAQIVAQHPSDPAAGEALVLLGNLDYPRAGLADAFERPLSGGDPAAARKSYTQSLKLFPNGARAPEALFKLGLLGLDRSVPGRNLGEAANYFALLNRNFPADPAAARGRLGQGLVEVLQGRDALALAPLAEAATTAGDAPTRAWAWLQLARVEGRMGLYASALTHLGHAQQDPGVAAQAKPLVQLALRMLALADKPWRLDATYVPQLPPVAKGATRLAARPGGVALLDERGNAIVQFGAGGAMEKTSVVGSPVDIAWMEGRELVVAESGTVKVGDAPAMRLTVKGAGGAPLELTRISAVATLPGRELAVADERQAVVYRFSATGQFLGAVFESEGRFDGLAADSLGRYWVLDRRARAVYLVSPEGRLITQITGGSAPGLERPVALAVDGFDHPWLLDEKTGRIWIHGADGRPAGAFDPPARQGKPVSADAMSVDPSGVIHVFDHNGKALLRYR